MLTKGPTCHNFTIYTKYLALGIRPGRWPAAGDYAVAALRRAGTRERGRSREGRRGAIWWRRHHLWATGDWLATRWSGGGHRGATASQSTRKRSEMLSRTSSTPRTSLNGQRRTGRSTATARPRRSSDSCREDGVDAGDSGLPASIPLSSRTRTARRSSWARRRGLGQRRTTAWLGAVAYNVLNGGRPWVSRCRRCLGSSAWLGAARNYQWRAVEPRLAVLYSPAVAREEHTPAAAGRNRDGSAIFLFYFTFFFPIDGTRGMLVQKGKL